MSVITTKTNDTKLNGYLDGIRYGEFGRDVRGSMAAAAQRIYDVVLERTGGKPQNGVKQETIDTHLARIRSAVFGEEVRDAMKTVLEKCYLARGLSLPTNSANQFQQNLEAMIYAQKGEDLKNNILKSIIQCYEDIKR